MKSNKLFYARLEVFTAMKIQFVVVTSCNVVVGYQHFRGPCCLRHFRNEQWHHL